MIADTRILSAAFHSIAMDPLYELMAGLKVFAGGAVPGTLS